MREALSRHRDAEAVFFLGDGLSDIESFINADLGKRTWFFVRGNCDYFGNILDTEAKK
jgi:predicted phosphodiesterase